MRKRPKLLMNPNGSATLLLAIIVLIGPIRYESTSCAYMEQQAAALQPAFRSDLEALGNAPRYTIEASIAPETGQVTGQMRLKYTNTTGDTLAELAFRLLPNAPTIYGGGSLGVERAMRGKTALKTALSDDRTVLRVLLERPLKPGQTTSIDLSFHARVPAQTRQGYGIFNRALGVVSLAGWYPLLAVYDDSWQTPPVPATGDVMWAETSLYEVVLTVPPNYEVVSTGVLLRQEKSTQEVIWHFVSGPAREFAVAISDRFQVHEAQVDEVTLRLYTLPADKAVVSAENGKEIMGEVFDTYVDRFGPYPFVELDLVETAVTIDGYEFSGMAFVDYAVRTQEAVTDYQYIVAHEVAHQWWYGLVGNHTVNEPWLDESLAAYSATIYVGDSKGIDAAKRLLAAWERAEGAHAPEDPPLNSPVLDFASWGPYHRTVYTHGALFLNQLRQELGDEKFFDLLQRYQAIYRYQIATTADFLDLAQEVAGRDLNYLFDDWFETTVPKRRSPKNR